MRTHPLVALAVVAAAISTITVFGQSAPGLAPSTVPAKKAHAPRPAAPKPAALSAVPAWLAASATAP